MRLLPIGIVLLAVLSPRLGRADVLTFEEAVRRAEKHSPELAEARALVLQARGRRIEASYVVPSEPAVDVRLEEDRLLGNEGERLFEVGIQQEIEIAGQRGLRIGVADAEAAAAGMQIDVARLEVRGEVGVAYYELVYEERRTKLFETMVAQAVRLVEAARRRLAAGDIGEAEFGLITADLVAVRAEAADAGAARDAARARLNVRVGNGADAPTSTAGEFAPAPAAAAVRVLVARARKTRPELRVVAKAIEARVREVRLRRRERIPNPVLSIGYVRERSVLPSELFSPGALVAGSEVDHFLGVRLSIPLPLFRRGKAEIARARGRKAEAEARKAGVSAAIERQVAVARADYEAARAKVKSYAGLATKLAETLALYEKAYVSGQINLPAYLAVRDRIIRARLAGVEASRDSVVSATRLEAAVGGSFE